jgi:hypothetical protein
MRCMLGIVLLCLIGGALGDDLLPQAHTPQAHTPPQSPFQPKRLETRGGPVQYEGRALIDAKYAFVFDEESGYDQDPHLLLVPDHESLARLPYLTRWVTKSDDDPKLVEWTDKAKEIWVTNVSQAAVLLLGKTQAEEVMAGKRKVVGEAVVVIEGFSAGYECDLPWFETVLVEVKREASAPSAMTNHVGGC